MGRRTRNSSPRRALWRARGEQAERIGRALEREVAEVLRHMVSSGELTSYVYHRPHSDEDRAGKDFTAKRGRTRRSFGVSTSAIGSVISQGKHKVPVLYVPRQSPTGSLVVEFVNGLFDSK